MRFLSLHARIGAALAATVLTLASPAIGATSIANACPPDRVPPTTFNDTFGNAHKDAIDCVAWYGIARGITQDIYAPERAVRRDQMASFMARSVTAMRGSLPEPTRQHFNDLSGNPHQRAIEQLAEAGIVSGTSPGRYSPDRAVLRGQMATFLVTTYQYLTAETLTASRDYFTDDAGHTHEANINKAAEAGFAGGVGGGRYAPNGQVRRDQMASFIARMINRAVDRAPGGRLTPYPMGRAVLLVDSWELRVVSSDPNATDKVLAENEFNDPPKEGHQFFMARVRATYRGEGSSQFDGSSRLRALGPSGVTYSTFANYCGVIPDELGDPETFQGGTIEGNVCWEVQSSDAAGLVMFDDEQERPSRPYFDL